MGSKAEKKVIIVGKYCVGKTALIHRFTTNRFNELSSYEPTIGAAYVAKKMTVGKKIRHSWNMGHSRFRTL